MSYTCADDGSKDCECHIIDRSKAPTLGSKLITIAPGETKVRVWPPKT